MRHVCTRCRRRGSDAGCRARPWFSSKQPRQAAFPFTRASRLAWSSSLDDEGKNAGRFEEGRGLCFPVLRMSMGHDAAGGAAAFPPAAPSTAVWCFPLNVTESSVRVGFVEGVNESVSPVTETASVIVTVRLITCVLCLDGQGCARKWCEQDSKAG